MPTQAFLNGMAQRGMALYGTHASGGLQEAGLTYRQTLALLEIDRSVMAHRRDMRQVRDKEYWERLYEAVKPFLEEKR